MNWEKIRSVSLKAQTIAFTICGGTMVILLTLNGLGRYLLGMGLSWADEVTRVMFVWGCFIGMTSAFISDAHIGFDSFAKMNRTTSFISQVVNGICLVLLGLMIMIYGAQFTMKMGKFPFASAFAAPVIITIPLFPARMPLLRAPNHLGIRPDQEIISPALQLFSVRGVQNRVIFPVICSPHVILPTLQFF